MVNYKWIRENFQPLCIPLVSYKHHRHFADMKRLYVVLVPVRSSNAEHLRIQFVFKYLYTPPDFRDIFLNQLHQNPRLRFVVHRVRWEIPGLQSATKDKTNTEQIHSPLLPHNFEFMLWIGYYFKNISRRIILFSELSRFCASWQTTKHVRVKSSQWQKFPRR